MGKCENVIYLGSHTSNEHRTPLELQLSRGQLTIYGPRAGTNVQLLGLNCKDGQEVGA